MSINARTTANALIKLWEAAADALPTEDLEWIRDMSNVAELEARNISATFSTLANLAANTSEADQPTRAELTGIFYSASYQLDTIAALIEIAGGAAYCLETSAKLKAEERRRTTDV